MFYPWSLRILHSYRISSLTYLLRHMFYYLLKISLLSVLGFEIENELQWFLGCSQWKEKKKSSLSRNPQACLELEPSMPMKPEKPLYVNHFEVKKIYPLFIKI